MWKDYSVSFIKKNKASSISIMAAALISALFLSLLCSLFYNFWTYEIESIVIEEGDWQGRITGDFSEDDLNTMRNFANVESAAVNEELSGEQETVVDICFQNPRTIFRDMPLITEKLGLEEDAAEYHLLLLSRYLIHDPQDEEPPLLMAFYLAVLLVVSLSLILIIHNSFAVSMNARVHQFGIFSSIGATPGQIRICLMQEAAALCALPVLAGNLLGTALSYGAFQAANRIAADAAGRHEAVWSYHPLLAAVSILASFLTVWISAWIPARKLSRLTPLQAIRNADGLQMKKPRTSRILAFLFGVEGELAGNALKAQKKALRTSTLSLTLSFLGFTVMLCFLTLSGISTDHTYFERYQDAWDVMAEIPDTKIEDFGLSEEIRSIQGIESCIVYQKAVSQCRISENDVSGELTAIGGLEAVAGISAAEGDYLAQASVVIMDDAGFVEYCGQIGVPASFGGSIVLNRIWDSVNSNFRYREYIPYVKENRKVMILQNAGKEMEIPALAYTREAPVLREEYEDYAFVQFMPVSLWKEKAGAGTAETDVYVRLLAEEGTLAEIGEAAGGKPDRMAEEETAGKSDGMAEEETAGKLDGMAEEETAVESNGLSEQETLANLDKLEAELKQLLGREYDVETENRMREKLTNDRMIRGYMLLTGAFCSLLALIGIANVFSNTLGFLRQRKREFAQYMSLGMTPEGMRKMFRIEALVIAGRPLLITLPLTAAAVGFMITASYLNPMEFLVKLPLLPIIVFSAMIFLFVGAAYDIGGKRICRCNLSEALKDDSLY